jgi:Zn-dependent protease
MRIRQDRAFWYVLGGLALLYVVSIVIQGGVDGLGRGLAQFAVTIAGLILAVTVHEAAHAWSANYLGDPTARLAGRVTLNPLAHLDPLGSLMMVITALTGVGIGWGKPTPVRPWRLRYGARLGNGIVALAGPVSNILLATVLGLVLRVADPRSAWLFLVLSSIVLTNLFIAMFNLLPVYPLDGHSVLLGLLSLSKSRLAWNVSQFFVRLEGSGPLLLVGLIILTQFLRFPLLSWAVGVPALSLYRLIVG